MSTLTSEAEVPIPLTLIPEALTKGGLLRLDLPEELPDVAPTDVHSLSVKPSADGGGHVVEIEGHLALGQAPGDPAARHFYLTEEGVSALRPEGESRRYWKIAKRH